MPSIPPKKTRKRLTIKEKVELIELSLKGFKNVDLSTTQSRISNFFGTNQLILR
jgi:hypothetical protein